MSYKLKDLLDHINVSLKLSTDIEVRAALKIIEEVQDFTSDERDVIRAAYKNGPLYDGDLPSKKANSTLCNLRYMSKVIVKSEEGYNALTYKGFTAYKILTYLENIEKSQKVESDTNIKG